MRTLLRFQLAFAGWVAATVFQLSAASACGPVLTLQYSEASPDTFEMRLAPDADGTISEVTFDFTSSIGGAYVDHFYGPASRNTPTPPLLNSVDGFGRGSRRGSLSFRRFLPGQSFTLQVDLDDQVAAGNPNWLDGGEIKGTKVMATLLVPDGTRQSMTGTFKANGVAQLGERACF